MNIVKSLKIAFLENTSGSCFFTAYYLSQTRKGGNNLFLELLSMGLLDHNTAEVQANIKAADSIYYMQQRPSQVLL